MGKEGKSKSKGQYRASPSAMQNRGGTRGIETKGNGREHNESTKYKVRVKGNKKWEKDKILRMTHNICSSPTPNTTSSVVCRRQRRQRAGRRNGDSSRSRVA